MQRRPKQNASYRKFGKRKNKPLTSIEKNIETTDSNKNYTYKEYYQPAKVDTGQSDRWNKISALANWANVIVAVVLAFFTWHLWNEAIKATSISKQAADAATTAANAAKDANRISNNNYELAKQSYESGNIEAQKRFSIDSQSLKTQINSIKESQRQFTIANEPILNLDSVNIDVTLNRPISARCKITNLNAYTARIIGGMTFISTSQKLSGLKNWRDSLDKVFDYTGFYVNKGKIVDLFADEAPRVLSKFRLDKIIKGDWFIWFGVVVIYENIVTGGQKKYVYVTKYSFQEKRFYVLENSNTILTKAVKTKGHLIE